MYKITKESAVIKKMLTLFFVNDIVFDVCSFWVFYSFEEHIKNNRRTLL